MQTGGKQVFLTSNFPRPRHSSDPMRSASLVRFVIWIPQMFRFTNRNESQRFSSALPLMFQALDAWDQLAIACDLMTTFNLSKIQSLKFSSLASFLAKEKKQEKSPNHATWTTVNHTALLPVFDMQAGSRSNIFQNRFYCWNSAWQ